MAAVGSNTEELGDLRLERRRLQIQKRLEEAPSESFPSSLVTSRELQGFYRFIENSSVTAPAVLRPHQQEVWENAGEVDEVVIVHDTTTCQVRRTDESSGDLWRLGSNRFGFGLHVSLAISGDGNRQILGVADMELFDPTHRPTGETPTQRYQAPSKIQLRWKRGILNTDRAFREAGHIPIHVADREGDCFEHLEDYHDADIRYVIRAKHLNRRLNWPDDRPASKPARLRETFHQAEPLARRTIEVSAREYPADSAPARRKKHPERDGREAEVEIRAARVPLRPPHTSGFHTDKQRLWVHVVFVSELNPPEGAEPIEWTLLTSLPVDTPAQVDQVVDTYCDRWTIEEYNKALKTGCRLESRQLETLHTFANATALLAPVACNLLELRSRSRRTPDAPASDHFPQSLRHAAVVRSNIEGIDAVAEPTVQELYQTIADLGGHIRNNGKPGWQVLWRGMKKVNDTQKVLDAVQHDGNGDVINL